MFSCTVKSSFIPRDHVAAIRDAIAFSRNEVPLQLIDILQQNTDNAPAASSNGAEGAVDTGEFRDGWEVSHTTAGVVEITNRTAGAGAIENGRPAGSAMPPIDAISSWIGRNLDVDEAKQSSVAFLIARAIAERGLKPRYVVRRSLPEMLNAAAVAANVDIDRRYARLALTPQRTV